MKRFWIFAFGAVGVGLAVFFTVATGNDFNLSDFWETTLSYLRRGFDKVTKGAEQLTGQSSAYTQALDLIAGFEGFRSKAYRDAKGYSIGYGHFIRSGDGLDLSSVVTESQARTLLEADAQSAYDCVSSSVDVSKLNDNQIAALISFVYNVGCGAFQSSTMLSKINDGDLTGAANEFPRWTKSQGQTVNALVTRRASEAEVFSA